MTEKKFKKLDLILEMRDTLLVEYNIPEEDFTNSRKQMCVMIREAMWLWIYGHEEVSTTMIGDMFKRDHATVLWGMRQARSLLDSKDRLAIEVWDKLRLMAKLKDMERNKAIYVSLPKEEGEEAEKRNERAKKKFKAQGFTKITTSSDLMLDERGEFDENAWMGRRIEALLQSDIVVLAQGWYDDNRCQLERDACERFHIECFTDGKL